MLNSRSRRGFTLAEVIVAFALVAVMTAVTVPTIRARLQDSYEDAIASEFETLASAIAAYRQDVGKYPPALDYLSQLESPPFDRCGIQLTATAQANWHGPYVSRNIGNFTQYTIAGKSSVQITIGPSKSTFPGLAIEVTNVDAKAANDLDLKFDGVANANAGTIFIDPQTTSDNVYYNIPAKTSTVC